MATVRQDIEVRVLDKTSRALSNVKTRLQGIQTGLLGVNRIAGLAVTALGAIGGAGLIKGIIDTSARFQDLNSTLATVTGSAKAGAEAFDFITKFSTKTQFGVEELTQSYIKLSANGIDPSEELLSRFANAAAITTDQIGSLNAITDLYTRSLQSQTVELTDLERLADRGFPVYDIIKEKLGITRAEIGKFSKEVGGTQKILDAIGDTIDERFSDATENLLQNLSIQFSNFGIAVKDAQFAIGKQGLAQAIGETAQELTAFIQDNDAAVKSIGINLTKAFLFAKESIVLVIQNLDLLAKAFGIFFGLKIALGVTTIAIAFAGKLVKAIALTITSLKLLAVVSSRHPLIAGAVVIAGGIGAMTGAFEKLAEVTSGVTDAAIQGLTGSADKLLETMDESIPGFEEYRNEIDKIARGQTGVFTGGGAEIAEGMIKKSLETTKDYNEATGKTGEEVQKNTKKFKFYTDAIIRHQKVLEANSRIIEETPTLLESYAEGIQEAFMTGEKAVAAFGDLGMKTFNSLSDEITNFVMTGKFNFRNFANSVISDLVRIAVQAAITFAIKTAAKAFGIPFFAEGGNIPRNQPAIVGEKGPELFIPKTAGTILSNEDSQTAMTPAGGGGNVNVNFTIVANDTRGFDELLQSRRATIQGIINGALNQKGRVGVV